MHPTGQQLLKLMFRPGESICVSPNKYGFHSVPLESALEGTVALTSPDTKIPTQYCDTNALLLVALNPIIGFRQDVNATAFRSFLIEMDYGELDQQAAYVNNMGMPYSAVVFSGNKSLHYLISLSTDIPSEKGYRYLAEWILNIMTNADQNCKNPSRSIRIPGAYREIGKQQLLRELNGPISLSQLRFWLERHPNERPRERERLITDLSDLPGKTGLKPWAAKLVRFGLDPRKSRNKQWFALACEFALAGYSEDDTVNILGKRFSEDRDFKEKEWKAAIRSGFKHIYEHRK